MPSFEEFFFETKGKPITYDGKTLVMADFLPVEDGETLRLVFESVNSEWRQGVGLRTSDKGKGSFVIDGEKYKSPIAVWRKATPNVLEFIVRTKSGKILVYNIWESDKCSVDFWNHGAAMIVEEIPNGHRYLCNDGHPDENFDDIIFRIERVASADKK